MNKSILFAAFTAVALSAPPAFANEAHHSKRDKKTASAKSNKTTRNADKQIDIQMGQMQGQIKKMQAQMEEIRKTTNSEERQKLMRQHMQSMREGMTTMRNLCDDMEEGEDMEAADEMMEKYMHIMQMMLDQMAEHQVEQEFLPLQK